jgi:hypothetical protein
MRTTRDGQSALLLFDVVEVLNREKIDYAVIGAIAGSVHGVVRASVDADLVISIARKDFASLEGKFRAIGFSASLREGDFEDPIPALLELMDAYDNRVDLLAGILGLELAAFARAIDVPFQGEVLKVLGREDFIATKVFAGGPQDLIDAQNTIAVAGDNLDIVALRRITKLFGLDALRALEKILNAR